MLSLQASPQPTDGGNFHHTLKYAVCITTVLLLAKPGGSGDKCDTQNGNLLQFVRTCSHSH